MRIDTPPRKPRWHGGCRNRHLATAAVSQMHSARKPEKQSVSPSSKEGCGHRRLPQEPALKARPGPRGDDLCHRALDDMLVSGALGEDRCTADARDLLHLLRHGLRGHEQRRRLMLQRDRSAPWSPSPVFARVEQAVRELFGVCESGR